MTFVYDVPTSLKIPTVLSSGFGYFSAVEALGENNY